MAPGTAGVGLAGYYFREQWLPGARTFWETGQLPGPAPRDLPEVSSAPTGSDHGGHDHAGHSELTSIEISDQARQNIGLTVGKVELRDFTRSIQVPGIVVERPGRSTVQVTAPLTGIVARIYLTEGEAVSPGQKLFDVRLTHEELVQSQADLLRTVEELDVIGREIARIQKLVADNSVPGKTLLDRQYEQQRQQGALRSQRQALLLHGLSESQIDAIVQTRKLLASLSIFAPAATEQTGAASAAPFFQVQTLRVTQGQHVTAGDSLAELVDHSELFIEGNAFERDIAEIGRASAAGKPVAALLETEGQVPRLVPDLRVLYTAARIDPTARTLHFYVTLPNHVEQDSTIDGRRYVAWQFRPGQRTQLRIPVETWEQRVVLPVDAVAQEGIESYVFAANGDHFDRRPVHVEFKDSLWAVIANDGALFPGDAIALSGAKQLQLALKNKSGGPVDPHAGHSH
ncbi:MAG: efflux RND transporter periplasmic adaptor subunit [Pirellulaceae bacterium]|nr:efflux RND transporter periplasmic adaptor subunit [Pirellulaceae bacterium]